MSAQLPSTLPAFLWHFIRQQKWQFAVLLAAPATHFLEYNILPYALKLIVDTVSHFEGPKNHAWEALKGPIGLYFAVWLGWIVIWRGQHWIYTKTFPRFQAAIRMEVLEYTRQHSHQYFADHFAGSIANKIADLSRSSCNLIDLFRWRFITTISTFIIGIGMMSRISPEFSLILLVWVVAQMSVAWYFARRITRYSFLHSEDRTILNGHIVDLLTNITAVRLFARNAFEQRFVGGYQAIEQKSNLRMQVETWKINMVMEIPALLMGMAVMYTLVKGWQQGWVSEGDIVFILYSSFAMLGTVWQLGTELPNFFGEIGTCKQALTLIARPHSIVDAPGAPALTVPHGEITFDNVHFHYIPGRNIFHDKNITIRGGEKVGLVGFSGSGKSTFVNLILRLYGVESGRILIDGQDISGVTQDSLHEAIAMIPQDTTLFHRSLMENIRYGKPAASDDEVINASRQAHCDMFIRQTEQGYNSLVGERGIKLSGGQRQRIAIARAILKNAPILILDEATSSLDSFTEKYIQQSLAELMRGRTSIVIAHRLSTLAHMDRILVFKEGEIIEDGSHDALLKAGGHYAMLWQMQAGGFLPEATE